MHSKNLKPLLTLLSFLLCAFVGSAQDTLYRINGKKQVVKILEVGTKQVKYKMGDGSSGPVFLLSRGEVDKIAYSTGQVDYISGAPSGSGINTGGTYMGAELAPVSVWETPKKPDPISTNFKRRYVNICIPDFFTGALTLGYEYFNKTGDYSLRVPVSIGLKAIGLNRFATQEYEGSPQAYYRENKLFSTGFDCYYYPNGQGRVRYYIGPSVELGWFKYTDIQYNNTTPPYGNAESEENGSFQSILLQNGFLFQPTPEINFNLGLGLGYCRTRYIHKDVNNREPGGDYYGTKEAEFAARFMVNVGYKF